MTGHILGGVVLGGGLLGATLFLFRRAAAYGVFWPVAAGFMLRIGVMLIAHLLSASAGERGIMFLDDQTYLHSGAELASAWGSGHFANPAAYNYFGSYEFGYPVLVAAVFTVAGPSVIAVKLVDVVIGSVTVLLVGLVGRRLLGASATVATTWTAALMPTMVWWSAPMLKEGFATFLMVASLLAILHLPDRRAVGGLAAALLLLALTRAAAAGAITAGFLAAVGAALVAARGERRWRALGRRAAVGLLAAGLALLALTGGHPTELVAEYQSTITRMFHEYEGGRLTTVPANTFKSLVTPVPWAFGSATRDWDRGLYPGVWALFLLYPTALRGLWRLRRRPELMTLGATTAIVLLVNAATSGFVFRQRSVIEPLVVILAVAGMRSWRSFVRWGAVAIGLAGLAAAADTRSPTTTAVILLAAGALAYAARWLPDGELRRELMPSPAVVLVGSAGTPTLGGVRTWVLAMWRLRGLAPVVAAREGVEGRSGFWGLAQAMVTHAPVYDQPSAGKRREAAVGVLRLRSFAPEVVSGGAAQPPVAAPSLAAIRAVVSAIWGLRPLGAAVTLIRMARSAPIFALGGVRAGVLAMWRLRGLAPVVAAREGVEGRSGFWGMGQAMVARAPIYDQSSAGRRRTAAIMVEQRAPRFSDLAQALASRAPTYVRPADEHDPALLTIWRVRSLAPEVATSAGGGHASRFEGIALALARYAPEPTSNVPRRPMHHRMGAARTETASRSAA